jgi:23S rRNA pseudouridine2605 synthase
VYKEPGLSPAVLRSWFPESTGAGAPGRKRRNRPGGGTNPNADGNRAHPPRSADNIGNTNRPRGPHSSGNTGNSLHEGAPRGPRNNRFGRRGPRQPR